MHLLKKANVKAIFWKSSQTEKHFSLSIKKYAEVEEISKFL